MRKLRRALLFFAVLFCGARVGVAEPVAIYRNVPFSHPNGRAICLDLFVPKSEHAPPLVMWFHGGGWRFGDKRLAFHLRGLTAYGFAVASVQYRLSLSAKWPAQREDAFAAYRWLRENVARYGVDPSRIAVSGESAGAHLAALIAVSEGAPKVKAAVLLYPPTDIPALAGRYRESRYLNLINLLFGKSYSAAAEAMRDASPVNHIGRSPPAFLLFHGERDVVVPVEQSTELVAKLRAAGGEARLIVKPGVPHGFSLRADEVKTAAAFLDAHLRGCEPMRLPFAAGRR